MTDYTVITKESDDGGVYYLVTDEDATAYGIGDTVEEAIKDYEEALEEYRRLSYVE